MVDQARILSQGGVVAPTCNQLGLQSTVLALQVFNLVLHHALLPSQKSNAAC